MVSVKRSRYGNAHGYTLLEVLFVLGISGVLSTMAVLQIQNARTSLKGDAAMRVVLSRLTQARETAIVQRRYIEVTFDTVRNEMSLVREDTIATTTTLATMNFEGGASFGIVSGLPDTPDAFGNAAATSFTSSSGTFASSSGATNVVKFAPDGTLVDWNGRTTNGTIFLALANNAPMSVRAATILGSTGRIRGYRWNGRNWTRV